MEGGHKGTAWPIGLDRAFRGEKGLYCWRPFLLFRFLLGTQKKMKAMTRPKISLQVRH